MVVLLVSGVFWTQEAEQALATGTAAAYGKKCSQALTDIVALVRGELSSLERATLGALVVMDVHARDVVQV
jgi:dynein heavy chain